MGLGEPWSSSRLGDVPHGVEQLTQLAAACASQPSILILDEPLAGLSAGEVDEVATILRRLKAGGVTIIVVEHQTRFIFDVCDEVTVLAAGELVKAGQRRRRSAPTTACARFTSAYDDMPPPGPAAHRPRRLAVRRLSAGYGRFDVVHDMSLHVV